MKNHKTSSEQTPLSQSKGSRTIKTGLTLILTILNLLLYAQNQKKIDSLFTVLKTAKADTTRVQAYAGLCRQYYSSNPDTALYFGNLGLNLAIKVNFKKGMATCYSNIGIVHTYQGSYHKATEYYLKSLKITEESGDKKGMSMCYNNIGSVHSDQGSYDKAIEYYLKALKTLEELQDKKGMSMCYNNIGSVHHYQRLYDKAIDYYFKALKIREKLGDKKGMSNCYNNIGLVHSDQGRYDKAIEYYLKSLKIKEELGDKNGLVACYINIGSLNISLADSAALNENQRLNYLNKAIEYGTKAIKLAQEIKAMPREKEAADNLMKAYKKLGNFKKSVEFAEIFIAAKDSMFKEEKTKALAGMEAKYQNEKKQLELDKLGKEKELQLSENKKQRLIILFVVCGLVMIIVFAVFVVNRLRITRRQKRTITDSIRYAERIQKAMLPDMKNFSFQKGETFMLDYFILFKPKDIVSGDFYFAEQKKNWLLIAVADCTGHGVPGAFMSMLGISFLNEIIAKEEIQTPSHALDDLRQYVIHSLQQKGITGEQKDGMDIAFIALNTLNNELQFAGANNPLYLIKQFENDNTNIQNSSSDSLKDKSETTNFQIDKLTNSLIEYKGDRQPIGIYENMKPFTNHVIKLQKGDTIYLMSDGYKDQFGGPKNKMFKAKQLKELLVANGLKPMNEQKTILNQAFEHWKGNNEQIDDVTVLGLRI
ncbi:MAG: tetratricopeptide repeat protein [Bacteroidia bacterium]|nr:tetratricopeptide repeat protein [Bacteroidia bacterium]